MIRELFTFRRDVESAQDGPYNTLRRELGVALMTATVNQSKVEEQDHRGVLQGLWSYSE